MIRQAETQGNGDLVVPDGAAPLTPPARPSCRLAGLLFHRHFQCLAVGGLGAGDELHLVDAHLWE